jgi:hypothetical protein
MVKLLVKWDADVYQADNSLRIFNAVLLCRDSNEVESQAMKHMLEILRILKGTKLLSVSCLSDQILLCHESVFYFSGFILFLT